MVLDLFSKYGWIVPLKDKKGKTVTEAFKPIFKEGRKPQYLWTDIGKEYYNKNMKELYSTNLVFVKVTVELKPECGSSSLSRVIPYIWTYYQKYWNSIITPNTVPLK